MRPILLRSSHFDFSEAHLCGLQKVEVSQDALSGFLTARPATGIPIAMTNPEKSRLPAFHALDSLVARAMEARFTLLCFRQKLPNTSDSEAALPLLRLTRADEKHMAAVRKLSMRFTVQTMNAANYGTASSQSYLSLPILPVLATPRALVCIFTVLAGLWLFIFDHPVTALPIEAKIRVMIFLKDVCVT